MRWITDLTAGTPIPSARNYLKGNPSGSRIKVIAIKWGGEDAVFVSDPRQVAAAVIDIDGVLANLKAYGMVVKDQVQERLEYAVLELVKEAIREMSHEGPPCYRNSGIQYE